MRHLHQSFYLYLKFMFLTKENYPNNNEIILVQKFHICWIIYDLTEDEMLLPKFRSSYQYFLDFIVDICGDKLLNETRNNLPPIYLPAISSNYSHIINFLNDKYDPNTFNQHRLLDFAVTVLFLKYCFV